MESSQTKEVSQRVEIDAAPHSPDNYVSVLVLTEMTQVGHQVTINNTRQFWNQGQGQVKDSSVATESKMVGSRNDVCYKASYVIKEYSWVESMDCNKVFVGKHSSTCLARVAQYGLDLGHLDVMIAFVCKTIKRRFVHLSQWGL